MLRNWTIILVVGVIAFAFFYGVGNENNNEANLEKTQRAQISAGALRDTIQTGNTLEKQISAKDSADDITLPEFAEQRYDTPSEPISALEQLDDFETSLLACLPDLASTDSEELEKNIDEHFNSLENSESKHGSLVYALFSALPEGTSRLDVLLANQDKLAAEPLAMKQLLAECGNPNAGCDTELIANALSADINNGAMWLEAIIAYAGLGQGGLVLAAIEELKKTATFNERMGETTLLYANALDESQVVDFNIAAIAGFGKYAAAQLHFSNITNWCEANINEAASSFACLELGEQLEQRAGAVITQMMGLALQEQVYKHQNNNVQLTQIASRRQIAMDKNRQQSGGVEDIMSLLDERLMRSWLTNLDHYGEYEAADLRIQDAKLLYESKSNYLCSFIHDAIRLAM